MKKKKIISAVCLATMISTTVVQANVTTASMAISTEQSATPTLTGSYESDKINAQRTIYGEAEIGQSGVKVALKVTKPTDGVNISSLKFTQKGENEMQNRNIKFEALQAQSDDGTIGHFVSKDGTFLKFTGTGVVEIPFTIADNKGNTSSEQVYRLLLVDSQAPEVTVKNKYIRIAEQPYKLEFTGKDNAYLNENKIKGTVSIKEKNSPNIDLGYSNLAISLLSPDGTQGGNSQTFKLTFTGTGKEPSDKVYKLRVGDDNAPYQKPENVKETDVNIVFVPKLKQPTELIAVDNLASISDAFLEEVIKKIKEANPDNAELQKLSTTAFTPGENGTFSIRYSSNDGSVDGAEDTVKVLREKTQEEKTLDSAKAEAIAEIEKAAKAKLDEIEKSNMTNEEKETAKSSVKSSKENFIRNINTAQTVDDVNELKSGALESINEAKTESENKKAAKAEIEKAVEAKENEINNSSLTDDQKERAMEELQKEEKLH